MDKSAAPRIVIVGAGAVGSEFASCYSRYGAKTVLVEVLPRRTSIRAPP